jgi:DNA polymerase elongation subunit (family B)
VVEFYTSVLKRGNKIFYRGYDKGLRVKECVEYEPYLFVPSPTGEYRSLDGRKFGKMNFSSIKDAKAFVDKYKDVDNFEIYGLDNFQYLYIYDKFPDLIEHDFSMIRTITLDLECKFDSGFPSIVRADQEITAVTLRFRGKSMVFGCEEYLGTDPSIEYVKCHDEIELLQMVVRCWESISPDIVTGWNIEFFDIPYLINRIRAVIGESWTLRLSPWKILDINEVAFHNKTNHSYVIVGVSVLDYYQLYRKFKFGNSESYKLDYISKVELNEQKLDYSEYGNLMDIYRADFTKYIDYNVRDCILVEKLEEKLKFLEQVVAYAYLAKVNYIDTLTTLRPSDMIIHSHLMNQGIVIPPVKKSTMFDSLMGGYVKEPKIGESRWVVSLDLDSLYPHLIMEYNISPEMFSTRYHNFPKIDELLTGEDPLSEYDRKSFSFAANGCAYRKDKSGFLPEIMQKLYDGRVKYKKLMLNAKKELAVVNAELVKL